MKLMKHAAVMSSALLVAGAMLMISFATAQTTPPAAAAAPSTQPINRFCAVEHDDDVDPAVTVTYKDQIIGFCCKDCVPKFQKDPEKYMKDLKK